TPPICFVSMAAASLLCKHNAAELVGATYDSVGRSALVTIQGDGVTTYDLEQGKLGSVPLGSRANLEFQAASVQHTVDGDDLPRYSVVASVLRDRTSNNHTLCYQNSSSQPRAISDAQVRIVLPGPAHSCHILHRQQQAAAGQTLRLAVVLSDGRVGVTEPSPEAAGPLTVLVANQQSSPRHVLAASSQDTLVVASQPAAGNSVTLRVLRLSAADASGVAVVKTVTLTCPGAGAHAVPTGLTLSPAFALLQWSNGHATAVHGLQGGAATPLRPSVFPLSDAVTANGASSSSAAPPPASASASSRKRKNAAAADGGNSPASRPRVLCAAVDDRQFVVLDLESSAAQSQVCYSLHDAQFGCPLSSGTVEVDAPLLSLDATQCAVVAAGPEAIIVRLGGAVHVLHVQSQPVSLLSLVARLSISAAAAAAAASGQSKAPKAGGRGVAAALVALPAPVNLDPGLLSGATPTAAANATAAGGEDEPADLVLHPVPAASVSRQEDICSSLVDQLSAVAPPAAPSQALLDSAVSYISGRRQHGMAVPPQLLSLTARGLAAAKQWSQLSALLSMVPPGGLCGCSDVLLAVVSEHEYSLLSRLATCLDEVDPEALVSALQQLLAPTTRANLTARQRHYQSLRAAAEARVAEAEQAAAAQQAAVHQQHPSRTPRASRGGGGGHGSGSPSLAEGSHALAVAQCAAAAVDGFSYREVLLHPLLAVPVDAPAVQVALRRLGAGAVEALLGYLAKWVRKYAGGAISETAASVALPQELLFPYYYQILEWTRMTIDAHLTRLLMTRTPLPALESLERSLRGAVAGSRRLLELRGALEHMQAAAPLPGAHMAVATQYTAEVLDLRVR
ncbi:hypothetical protein Agub_g2030, partial [Astrephomene gubernaculifera]